MTISINTSDYIKTQDAEINGVIFKVRAMTSAETIAYMELTQEMASMAGIKEIDQKAIKKVSDSLDRSLDLFTKCFTPQDKAKELFENVPIERWLEIYNKIMKGEE